MLGTQLSKWSYRLLEVKKVWVLHVSCTISLGGWMIFLPSLTSVLFAIKAQKDLSFRFRTFEQRLAMPELVQLWRNSHYGCHAYFVAADCVAIYVFILLKYPWSTYRQLSLVATNLFAVFCVLLSVWMDGCVRNSSDIITYIVIAVIQTAKCVTVFVSESSSSASGVNYLPW